MRLTSEKGIFVAKPKPTKFVTPEPRDRASCCSRRSPRTASRNYSTNSRTSTPADPKRTDRLNNLINGYTGCIDDAADLLELGIEKQQDIRDGVKALQARTQGISALPAGAWRPMGTERETYKDNLDDAIEATQDAAKDVDNAVKGNVRATGAAQTIVRAIAFSRTEKIAARRGPSWAATAFFNASSRGWDARAARRSFKWSCIPMPILSHTLRLRQDVALRAALRHFAGSARAGDRSRRRDFAGANVSPARAAGIARPLPPVRAGALHAAAHRAGAAQTRAPDRRRAKRRGARSGAHVRRAQRGIFSKASCRARGSAGARGRGDRSSAASILRWTRL